MSLEAARAAMSLLEALGRLAEGTDLAEEEMAASVEEIMEGRATAAQIGALLFGLRVKGETVDELVGAARVMRARCVRIRPRAAVILDTCGTGGDGLETFNISTASALVCAAAGVTVAKHGNRAMSGRVGGADVLEALGVTIDLPPERIERAIDAIGIGFLFAQTFHPAMKHAAGPRRELGVRTIFNLLGPLSNPAGATHQLVGVFADRWVEPIAAALGRLGTRRALVVHGMDGADEISLCAPTSVAELDAGRVRLYRVAPEDFGLRRCVARDLQAADAAHSARLVEAVLAGESGPHADVVALNAGAALYAAEAVDSIAAGVARARAVLAQGGATATLRALANVGRA